MRRGEAGKRRNGKLELGMWAMSCQYFNPLGSEHLKELTILGETLGVAWLARETRALSMSLFLGPCPAG